MREGGESAMYESHDDERALREHVGVVLAMSSAATKFFKCSVRPVGAMETLSATPLARKTTQPVFFDKSDAPTSVYASV